MPRPPVTSLDEAIDRSIQEQAEDPYRSPTTSALTQQVERSRQRQANIPGHHFRVNPYAATSAESDEDSDSDDSGLQIKYPSSKRPGDGPRQMMTPTPRRPNDDERDPQATRGNTLHAERPRRQRNEDTPTQPRQMMTPKPLRRPNDERPNEDEPKPQPSRGNTLHAERPRRQRNEEILSQQRPARIPSSDFFFEGQIPDEPAKPQKPQAARVNPPQGEKSQQQPHDDPRAGRPARISIPDILNHGTTNFQKLQAAQRPSKPAPKPQPEVAQRAPKPAPKPQPKEPKPESSSQNPKKPARLSIPQPRPRGFPTPQKPPQPTQRAPKPAPKPQPKESKPKPDSSSQNPKKPAGPAKPQPLHLGFPRPPKSTQATQLQSVTAQGRQPAEEEPEDSPSQRRRAGRRPTGATISDNRAGASESDDDIFVFRGNGDGGEGGMSNNLSDLKSAGR